MLTEENLKLDNERLKLEIERIKQDNIRINKETSLLDLKYAYWTLKLQSEFQIWGSVVLNLNFLSKAEMAVDISLVNLPGI